MNRAPISYSRSGSKAHWAFALISLLFLVGNGSMAQVTFEKYYDYGYAEGGRGVQQTFDGGYIVAGRQGITFGVANLVLIKTDSAGQVEWDKFIGNGSNENYGYSVQQTADSGYIVTGYTTGNGRHTYLVKTDSNGDTLWTKTYVSPESAIGWDVTQTYDGGYAIAVQHDTTAMLLKTDSIGNTLWTETFYPNGSQGTAAFSVWQTNDSGYVVAGVSTSIATGGDVYVVRTNKNGDTLWTRLYGGNFAERGQSVQQCADGGFIVAGYTWSYGQGNYDVYLLKVNANGDTLWTKTYGDVKENTGMSVRQTVDEGYIVCGNTFTLGPTNGNLLLLKTDSLGTEEWWKTYGGDDQDYGFCVSPTNDDGFVACGLSSSFAGTGVVYLVKTDSLGNSWPVGISPEPPAMSFTIYPNPTEGKFEVRSLELGVEKVEVYDLFGRLLLRSNEPQIDMSSYPAGLYVWQVGAARGKLVIE